MGLFSKLFGGGGGPPPSEPEPEPEPPAVVILLRRGMNVPKPEYVEAVLASAFPGGLPESVPRVALSQPSWFKTDEVAEQIAAGVVETFARKFEVGDPSSRRRVLDGPDGCEVMLVEIHRG